MGIAEPRRALAKWRGFDDFDFPATAELLTCSEHPPDVLHLHNLHGGYFDLRALPGLCQRVPTILTAHDTWLASGHCAYSVDCERWKTGCGACPHLNFPPSVRGDKTHENWQQKRALFEQCAGSLHLVGPAAWVTRQLEASILAPALASVTVIPNGVDQQVFRPVGSAAAKAALREQLGLPQQAFVICFSATGRQNPYKDYATLERALTTLQERLAEEPLRATGTAWCAASEGGAPEVVALLLGGHTCGSAAALEQQQGALLVRNLPFASNPQTVADWLGAADLYTHAARAEVLPLACLEAQSCGLPVIATDVGGVSETFVDGETGLLVPPGNPVALADGILALAHDGQRRRYLGEQAGKHAHIHFGLERMTERYLDCYEKLASD
jgi:glycosyltransferase involved in cell wall biosynthesis